MKTVRPYLRPFLVILGILAAEYFLLRRPAEKVTISVTPSVQTGLPTPPAAAQRTLDIVTLLPRDAIPAIDNPRFYSATEADEEYDPDELVLGVSFGGESRAYSTALLSSHEIVNDTVGGRKIAVTWWPLCFTGIVYSREVGGQELTFGVSGKLIMNALVMYDRQTDSLWSQILGEAVLGPMKGTKLEFVPALHTTWTDWKAEHPDTLALVKGYSGAYDSYLGYYQSRQAGVIGETYSDARLYVKEFVVGVEQNGEAAAYPFSALNEQPVVNDVIGGVPVLVLFDADSGASAVFDRRAGEQTLSFSVNPGAAAGVAPYVILTDAETGSTWAGMAGLADDGPLAGTQLVPVKSTRAFWFGWKDWYPDTRVFGQ